MANCDNLDDLVIPDEPFSTIKKRPAPPTPNQNSMKIKSNVQGGRNSPRNNITVAPLQRIDKTRTLPADNRKIGYSLLINICCCKIKYLLLYKSHVLVDVSLFLILFSQRRKTDTSFNFGPE